MSATPVTIVTGFLGAGKTTLLNRLLRHPEFRDTAVIVNEFGEIGLDHALVEQGQDRIVLLDAGCLCCVLADSLRETLVDLYQRRSTAAVPPFKRVVIETSGLADPAPVLESLAHDPLLAGRFATGAVLCVVDAGFGARTLAEHREAREQVAMADTLVVTKAAGADFSDLAGRLLAINPVAPMVDADELDDLPALLNAQPQWRAGPEPVHDHRHESDVTAHSLRLDHPVDWAGIAAWTDHLRARWEEALLRCKALIEVRGAVGPALVQGVRDRFAVTRLPAWPDDERGARIVIIGRNLDPGDLRRGLAWLDEAPFEDGFALTGFPHEKKALP